MRRADREIVSLDEMEAIMRRCEICRLVLNGDGYPYIVPLNFGYAREGDVFSLYFHCANEGMKLDLIRKDPRAAFEMEGMTEVVRDENACAFTMAYESLAGRGRVAITGEEEKRTGMAAVMQQYAPERSFAFGENTLDGVTILRLDVEQMTGKRNPRNG